MSILESFGVEAVFRTIGIMFLVSLIFLAITFKTTAGGDKDYKELDSKGLKKVKKIRLEKTW